MPNQTPLPPSPRSESEAIIQALHAAAAECVQTMEAARAAARAAAHVAAIEEADPEPPGDSKWGAVIAAFTSLATSLSLIAARYEGAADGFRNQARRVEEAARAAQSPIIIPALRPDRRN